MKGKRLLAVVLATVLLLGTMSFPAFADTTITFVHDYAEFKAAIEAKASYIKFANTITCDSSQVSGMIASFNHDCTVDLDTYTLDMTQNGGSFYTKANVTFTGVKDSAKIIFDNPGTDVFRCYDNALTVENLTFSGESHCYVISAQTSGKTVNVINCTLTDIPSIVDAEVNVFCNLSGADFNIINSTIDAGIGRAFLSYDPGKICLSGTTSVSGAKKNLGVFYIIGNDIQFNGTTETVSFPAASVTTASGNVTYYETFEVALSSSADGDTITLLQNCQCATTDVDCKVTENKTIALNGNTLEFTGDHAAFRGNWIVTGDTTRQSTSKKSTIKLSGNSDHADSLLSVGYYGSDNSTLSISNANIEAPSTYDSGCGFFGAYFGSTLELSNVTVVDTMNTLNNPNACKTIFYGQAPNENCTIKLTNVNITNIEAEKVIGNCANVEVDGLIFEGIVTESIMQAVTTASIQNSTFTFDDNNNAIIALYRDRGYDGNVSFDNTVFDNVPNCTSGMFEIESENSVVKAQENTVVISNANQTAFAAKVTAANGTVTKYITLADAIANAEDGDTVTLLTNAKGDGIAIKDNTFPAQGLTIDLGGYTYTVGGNLKGSSGTQSNGFYLERNNILTIQNGTITSSEDAKYYSSTDNCEYNPGILVQNHTEALTLKNVTLDGTNLRDEKFSYTLGNDNGTVTIINSKIIANTDGNGAVAFDADKSGTSYDFKGVTIDKDSIVTGYINITNGGSITCGDTTYTDDGQYYKHSGTLVSLNAAKSDRNIKAEATLHDVRAGQTFDVNVILTADDIATAGFKLSYDPTMFRLVDDPTNNGEIDFFDNAGGLASTYTSGDALATYTFEALAQSDAKTGDFTLSNTEAYTYEENRLGMTFEVSNTADQVKISLNSFTATVKLDGKAVDGDAATLNYDGKKHSVVVSVEPTDYQDIAMTYTVDGTKMYGEPAIKEPGIYEIEYNVVTYDGYEKCSGKFTLTILAPNAYFVEVNTGVEKAADYVAGKKLILVYTDLNNVAFKYDNKDMIEVTKTIGNYQYSGSETEQTNFSHVFAYVANKTTENTFESYQANVTPFILKEGYVIEKIDKYGFDINNNNAIDKQDPGTAIGVYGALDLYYDNYDAQKNILRADVNGDKCVTSKDVKEVTLAVFNK